MGKLSKFMMTNPLQERAGPKQIEVAYFGQLYKEIPHGIGIIVCKNVTVDSCPIRSASVQFYHGKLHGGPMILIYTIIGPQFSKNSKWSSQ
ncbi:hypothetical protein FGO68_gene13564 [Halteria grandinella]|uniref:Uncharacterized protein n=1 Tax=Halteria grandinella TaxID=5974 RepID=A0A8J8NJ61_HALGN|nr:hypothetical protein FGO68_gene13564 [Halteria grandinella]